MLNMFQINSIKELASFDYRPGEIERKLGIDIKTLKKILTNSYFSFTPPFSAETPSKLDFCKLLINKWLAGLSRIGSNSSIPRNGSLIDSVKSNPNSTLHTAPFSGMSEPSGWPLGLGPTRNLSGILERLRRISSFAEKESE